MLAELAALRTSQPTYTTAEFPLVLSAGERRAFTANDILRDPAWRTRDVDGALRISAGDAAALGLRSGDRARVVTAAGSAEATVEVSAAMQDGHAALPNGFGVDHTGADGVTVAPGVAPNTLTSADWRDAYAGTPWHKHVPARVEALQPSAGGPN
jgi:formate dehydrogenase